MKIIALILFLLFEITGIFTCLTILITGTQVTNNSIFALGFSGVGLLYLHMMNQDKEVK